MKKFFRQIHLWLSVPFGLVITIICFSGAMLVFEDEVTDFCRHDLYFVSKTDAPTISADSIAAIVTSSLPDSVSITGIVISADPERAWQVNLSKPRRASLMVNQYTGEIIGKNQRMSFFMTMFRLHRWLLDTMKPDGTIFWGKMVVGTATLMFVFVLISGVVIWWPRTVKALKNSLKIVVYKGWHRFWYSLHIAGGMYALIFLMVMALTGLTWSFTWYRSGFYKIFGVEMVQSSGNHGTSSTKNSGERAQRGEKPQREKSHDGNVPKRENEHRKVNMNRSDGHVSSGTQQHATAVEEFNSFVHWQTVFDELKNRNPDFTKISLSERTATVSFNRLGNRRAADRYEFDAQTGDITKSSLYSDLEGSAKIRGWIYSVHVGDWGGMPTRILSFFAALLGASLPLTGYYFWIRKLTMKKRKQ